MPNVFCIAGDTLIVGYYADRTDHDGALRQEMQICHLEKLKPNKNKCHFRCIKMPFFAEMISEEGVQPDLKKLHTLIEKPLNNKRVAIILRSNELPRNVFALNHRCM